MRLRLTLRRSVSYCSVLHALQSGIAGVWRPLPGSRASTSLKPRASEIACINEEVDNIMRRQPVLCKEDSVPSHVIIMVPPQVQIRIFSNRPIDDILRGVKIEHAANSVRIWVGEERVLGLRVLVL